MFLNETVPFEVHLDPECTWIASGPLAATSLRCITSVKSITLVPEIQTWM
jgi:hypothetical protein